MKNPLGFAGAIALVEPTCCVAVLGLATICGIVRFYKQKRSQQEQEQLLADVSTLASKAAAGTDVLRDLADGTIELKVNLDHFVKQDIAAYVNAAVGKSESVLRRAIHEEFLEAFRDHAIPEQAAYLGRTFPEFVETLEVLSWTADHRGREHTAMLKEIVEWIRTGGKDGSREFVRQHNLPPVSPTFVPRRKLTKSIHDALNASSHTGVIKQATARAYGGFGKTVAAILYAHEYAEQYPGGRFFLSMEGADFTERLASLGRYFGVPADAKPDMAAVAVKEALAGTADELGKSAASLLILDSVMDAAQWDRINGSGLIPHGSCRVAAYSLRRGPNISRILEL